jgi:nucleotide-binding universal stress UspA family protein
LRDCSSTTLREEVAVFKTIVLALDGSESSDRAIPVAQELARDGGSIIVAHVREKVMARGGGETRVDEDEIEQRVRASAAKLNEAGVKATVELGTSVAGGPAHAIAAIADRAGADLIVTGTRGHGVVAGLLVGSTAQRLLHLASCPVLIVPTPHGDAPGDASPTAASAATTP